jgi:hypothetical protein
MYNRIEAELRGVKQALHSSRTVSTAPPPSKEPELGDEPTQLCRIDDASKLIFVMHKKKKNRPQWP